MIYNNILNLLVVILILSSREIPQQPHIHWIPALLLFAGKGLLLFGAVRYFCRGRRLRATQDYFGLEQHFSIAAVLLLAVDVYLLDLHYYLARLPLAGKLPSLASLAGLAVFFAYLAIFWHGAYAGYRRAFASVIDRRSFIISNLKNQLAILLPWCVLTLALDLLQLLDLPIISRYLASPWGGLTIFLLFVGLLLLVFPRLAASLWNCRPLPPGPLRDRLEAFCRLHRLAYADILLWPLFEGKMLTAGVMGFVGRFRYLLVTPALLQSMTIQEIEAVMAHEIGHVKRHHLPLYLLLLLGFGLALQLSAPPLLDLLLTSPAFIALLAAGKNPFAVFNVLSTLLALVLLVLYFRYLFGFFMRNFERQADLYALKSSGSSVPLITVFEKIAILSGNIRDLPSWHHFSLGQRIAFLLHCERHPKAIFRHHRKVYLSLLLYFLLLAAGAFTLAGADLDNRNEEALIGASISFLELKLREEPENRAYLLPLADLQYRSRQFSAAMSTYERLLALAPDSSEALNNLAWLLLTCEQEELRDPVRALPLARRAADLEPKGHVLDTLAEAYFQNGQQGLAIDTIRRAMASDPATRDYYEEQLKKFTGQQGTFAPPDRSGE